MNAATQRETDPVIQLRHARQKLGGVILKQDHSSVFSIDTNMRLTSNILICYPYSQALSPFKVLHVNIQTSGAR